MPKTKTVATAAVAGGAAGEEGGGSEVRQVEVECVAPYEDQQWVGIGRARDGMEKDSVQYSLALRPPYHLASHIRLDPSTCKVSGQSKFSNYQLPIWIALSDCVPGRA